MAILANEFRRLIVDHVEKLFERGPIGRRIKIFGDVELDAKVPENVEYPARLTSAGVVKDVHHAPDRIFVDGQFGSTGEPGTLNVVTKTPSMPYRRPSLAGRVASGVMLVIAVVVVIWAVEVVDAMILDDRLQRNGISPRRVDGLDGVLWAPFLHDSFSHLIANTLPLAILGSLVMLHGHRVWWQTTISVVAVAGLATWLFARNGNHIGASSLVFGYLGFLVGAAVWDRSVRSILLGGVAAVFYGGMIWGFVPRSGISWEGHLFGAASGFCAAWAIFRSGWLSRPSQVAP